MKLKIKQHLSLPDAENIDNVTHGVVVELEKNTAPFPYHDVVARRRQERKTSADINTSFYTDLPNAAGTRLAVGRVAVDISPFALLSSARTLVAPLWEDNPTTLAVLLVDLPDELAARVAHALVAAILAALHTLPSYKSKPAPAKKLVALEFYGLPKTDFSRTLAMNEGNNLARYLTALPSNELTPRHYRERIAALAEEHGWNMHVYDSKALKRQRAGAFLAVAQGSAHDDAAIVQLCYSQRHHKGSAKSGPKPPLLALVGKGICYDTGGNNLKSAKSMYGMHEDMAGSAVALGTLLALTRLKAEMSVHCWLALAQNHIGPTAYKPNDVVTASNGVTIEVVHTDAEGRMILADTLAMASAERPDLLIDYATLTGACVYALGTRYSGAFTNRAELIDSIIAAGRSSGERVWPFPLDEDYDKELESEMADIKQCTLTGEADHILAARFLSRFVRNEVPWLHLDLAGANHKGGLAHIPTDVTGCGVRFTLDLLERGVLGAVKSL